MPQCSNCNETLTKETKFCPKCGTEYIKPIEPIRTTNSNDNTQSHTPTTDNTKIIAGVLLKIQRWCRKYLYYILQSFVLLFLHFLSIGIYLFLSKI